MNQVYSPREEANLVACPACGKEAIVTEYWSTSPQRPQVRLLKRQTSCEGKPQKGRRWGGSTSTTCPVVTEVLREELLADPKPAEATQATKGGIDMPDKLANLPYSESSSNGKIANDEQGLAGTGRISGEEPTRVARMPQQVSRSTRVVQKVMDYGSDPSDSRLAARVDRLIELLVDLPEPALEPLLSLVKLKRQEKHIRRSLLQALNEAGP